MKQFLAVTLAVVCTLATAGADYVGPLASIKLPDGWKQVESETDDTLIFSSASGQQQMVVIVERLKPPRGDVRERANAFARALRGRMASYQRLYGEDLVFDQNFATVAEPSRIQALCFGHAAKHGIRLALQAEAAGGRLRFVAAYDATGKTETEFQIWATGILERVR